MAGASSQAVHKVPTLSLHLGICRTYFQEQKGLWSEQRLLFIEHILFTGNSLPPALNEVGTLIDSTSQERKKVEGKGSCSRSHSWQVGERELEHSQVPVSPFRATWERVLGPLFDLPDDLCFSGPKRFSLLL